jgi:hypothetical protein
LLAVAEAEPIQDLAEVEQVDFVQLLQQPVVVDHLKLH